MAGFLETLRYRLASQALSRAQISTSDIEPLVNRLEKQVGGAQLARALGLTAGASTSSSEAVKRRLSDAIEHVDSAAQAIEQDPQLRVRASRDLQSRLLQLSGTALIGSGLAEGYAEYRRVTLEQVKVQGKITAGWRTAASQAFGLGAFRSALAAAELGASLDDVRDFQANYLAVSGSPATLKQLRAGAAHATALGVRVSDLTRYIVHTPDSFQIRESLGTVHAEFDELARGRARRSLRPAAGLWRKEFYEIVAKTRRDVKHLPRNIAFAASATRSLLESFDAAGVAGVKEKTALTEKVYSLMAGDGQLQAQVTWRVRSRVKAQATTLQRDLGLSRADARARAIDTLIDKRERPSVDAVFSMLEGTTVFDTQVAKDLGRTQLGAQAMSEILERRLQTMTRGASIAWLKSQGMSALEARTIDQMAREFRLSAAFTGDLSQGVDALEQARAQRGQRATDQLIRAIGPPTIFHQGARWAEAAKQTPVFLMAGGIGLLVGEKILETRQLKEIRVLLKSSTRNVISAARAAAGRSLAEQRAEMAARASAARLAQSTRRGGKIYQVYQSARGRIVGRWSTLFARLRRSAGPRKVSRLRAGIQRAIGRTTVYARTNAATRYAKAGYVNLRTLVGETAPRHLRALADQAKLSFRQARSLETGISSTGRKIFLASQPRATALADNIGTRTLRKLGGMTAKLNAGFLNSMTRLAGSAGKNFPTLARVLRSGLKVTSLAALGFGRFGARSVKLLGRGLSAVAKVLGRIPMLTLLTETAFAVPDIIRIVQSDMPLSDKISALSQVYGQVGWNVLYSPVEMAGSLFGLVGADQISRDVTMFGKEAYGGVHRVGTFAFESLLGVHDGFNAGAFRHAAQLAEQDATTIAEEFLAKYRDARQRRLDPSLQEYMHTALEKWRRSPSVAMFHRANSAGISEGSIGFDELLAAIWRRTGQRVFQEQYNEFAEIRNTLQAAGVRAAQAQETGGSFRFDNRKSQRDARLLDLEADFEIARDRFASRWKAALSRTPAARQQFFQWLESRDLVLRPFFTGQALYALPRGFQQATVADAEAWLEARGLSIESLREFGDYDEAMRYARVLLNLEMLEPYLVAAERFTSTPRIDTTLGEVAAEHSREARRLKLEQLPTAGGTLQGFARGVVEVSPAY